MTRPTALLVDDEPRLVALLRTELARQWPDLEIVGEALHGPTALEIAEARRPQIAFLDIKMPGMSGLEVARRLAGRCHVVFVTGFDQYAVQAFENNAVDYLLKPLEGKRLAVTVARLRAQLSTPPRDLGELLDGLAQRLRPKVSWLQWLTVQQDRDVMLVPVQDVAIFQASEKYTLALAPGHEWVIRTPLKELEEKLDPDRFWRVHRNAIVRVDAIARVARGDNGQAIVHFRELPVTIAVSRSYAHFFKQL